MWGHQVVDSWRDPLVSLPPDQGFRTPCWRRRRARLTLCSGSAGSPRTLPADSAGWACANARRHAPRTIPLPHQTCPLCSNARSLFTAGQPWSRRTEVTTQLTAPAAAAPTQPRRRREVISLLTPFRPSDGSQIREVGTRSTCQLTLEPSTESSDPRFQRQAVARGANDASDPSIALFMVSHGCVARCLSDIHQSVAHSHHARSLGSAACPLAPEVGLTAQIAATLPANTTVLSHCVGWIASRTQGS